jgi:2'-5' RNA ligase
MSLLRTFIAVDLPPHIQDAIQDKTARLRQSLDSSHVRWIPSHNLHLTLKFLGDTSPANVQFLQQMLTREADSYPSFDIQIENIGSFPNSRRPRVIWVGLKAPAVLASLQREIESATARLGYDPEERPFSPHLTIGRVRQNLPAAGIQMIYAALEAGKVGDIGTARIYSINIYKRDLNPGGSIYTRMFSAPLKNNP